MLDSAKTKDCFNLPLDLSCHAQMAHLSHSHGGVAWMMATALMFEGTPPHSTIAIGAKTSALLSKLADGLGSVQALKRGAVAVLRL